MCDEVYEQGKVVILSSLNISLSRFWIKSLGIPKPYILDSGP
jgi:hypothetical protein